MNKFTIDLIPGDGIGVDVIREARRVLERLAELHGGVRFVFNEFDWSCEYYLKHGRMMPEDGLSILRECDSILLGAVGFPSVPDHISLRQLLIPIRREFDQYVNLRPVKLLPGLDSPIRVERSEDIDFVVLRENSEGEYCGVGRIDESDPLNTKVIQEAHFSRKGTERIIRYAFDYAVRNGAKSLVSATKSNALNYSMVFWDKVFKEVEELYRPANLQTRSIHVDALAGFFIMKPQMLDVVVASNLFGDILTDLGSAMLGSIGISPSANINPERKFPSMFEPVHGSAPDIAGKGIANPIGTLWSVVLMLEHLRLNEMAELLFKAMGKVIAARKIRTPDICGTSTTEEVVNAVLNEATV